MDDFKNNLFSKEWSWDRFFLTYFLTLGSGFILAGIIFFFAFNWDALSHFLKLGIIFSSLVFAHILYYVCKPNSIEGKVSLVLLFFLYGLNLLIFGQIYQTGADAYDLFLYWAIITLIPVLVSLNFFVFNLWLTLVCLTVHLYFEQVYVGEDKPILFVILTILFGILTISLRKFYKNIFPDERERWLEPYIYFLSLQFLVFSGFDYSTYNVYRPPNQLAEFLLQWLFPIAYLGAMYYYFRIQDFAIPFISLTLLFGLFFLEVRISEFIHFDSLFSYFVNFIIILTYTVFSVKHLHSLSYEEKP